MNNQFGEEKQDYEIEAYSGKYWDRRHSMEKKVKYLEIIQGVISRMANNSFLMKGWAVTLVVGIFALSGKDADKLFFLLAYIPIIFFWLLDTYYLRQERLYRALFNRVREMNEEDIDFSLDISVQDSEMEKNRFTKCFVSPTELLFYFPLAMVCSLIVFLVLI